MNRVDRMLKAWAQEDKSVFQNILLLGQERGVLKKRGDIGSYASKDKRKQKKLDNFYKDIKENIGTVSDKRKREKEEYKEFKEMYPNAKIKGYNQLKTYSNMKKGIDEILTYAYNHYEPSNINAIDFATRGMMEEERINEVLKYLNNEFNDFSQGIHEPLKSEIDFSTSYEDVESWFA